jgi:hypothetical protein
VALLGAALTLACAAPAHAQWSVSANDGRSALTLGFLAQTQIEALESPGSSDVAQNVFVRRARLMLGARINDRTSLYMDTDVPNLGKGQTTGAKVANTLVLQDLVVTQTLCSSFKIDAGMLYVPLSHNAQQAVGSLLPVDYGPYTFAQNEGTDSKLGRDYGVDGRAYVAHKHLEIRAGVYQGDRGKNATEPFRVAARGVYYACDADTGFFYAGTAFGKKRMLALGAGVDAQKDYRAWSGDVTCDWPVQKDCLTLLAGFTRYDGGTTFAALPRQDDVLVELGWYSHAARVTPFVQYASRDYLDPARADEARVQGGLAFWGNGHKNSLKLGVAKLTKDRLADGFQYMAQWQVLAY